MFACEICRNSSTCKDRKLTEKIKKDINRLIDRNTPLWVDINCRNYSREISNSSHQPPLEPVEFDAVSDCEAVRKKGITLSEVLQKGYESGKYDR